MAKNGSTNGEKHNTKRTEIPATTTFYGEIGELTQGPSSERRTPNPHEDIENAPADFESNNKKLIDHSNRKRY